MNHPTTTEPTTVGLSQETYASERAHAKAFEEELAQLINRHNIERIADMPDFLLARMICDIIWTVGPNIKATLDWHGCNSVCHPRIDMTAKGEKPGS